MSIWIFGDECLNICKVSTWIFVNDVLFDLFWGSSHGVSYLQQLDHREISSSRFQTILEYVTEDYSSCLASGSVLSTVKSKVQADHVYSGWLDSHERSSQCLVQPSPTWPRMTLCSSTPVPYYVSFKMWWELCQLPGLKPEVLHKFGGRGA